MIGPEIQVPDVTEAVIGYRQFRLVKRSQHNYELVSPHTREPWPTVERTAKCNKTIESDKVILDGIRPKQHAAPHKDCGCGIYAYFEPCPVRKHDYSGFHGMRQEGEEVAVLMTMTGRIEVHSRGMRSQKARICAIGLNANLNADERAALTVIADGFGVPLVPQDELPKMAEKFGRPLDRSLRPATDEPSKPKPPVPVPSAGVTASGSGSAGSWTTSTSTAGYVAVSDSPHWPKVAPPMFSIWINVVVAVFQVICWFLWESPLNLFVMAGNASFASYYFGQRRALR